MVPPKRPVRPWCSLSMSFPPFTPVSTSPLWVSIVTDAHPPPVPPLFCCTFQRSFHCRRLPPPRAAWCMSCPGSLAPPSILLSVRVPLCFHHPLAVPKGQSEDGRECQGGGPAWDRMVFSPVTFMTHVRLSVREGDRRFPSCLGLAGPILFSPLFLCQSTPMAGAEPAGGAPFPLPRNFTCPEPSFLFRTPF